MRKTCPVIRKNGSRYINQQFFLTIGDFFLMKIIKQMKSYYIFGLGLITKFRNHIIVRWN